MKIAIYAITLHGAKQAQRLAKTLPFATVFVSDVGQELFQRNEAQAERLTLPLSDFMAQRFSDYDHHICFFATGVVSRMIAPLMVDKRTDPGVICIDDHANFVIPMLSGHRGGANALACRVAELLAATPVVTTASDVAGSLSVDMLGAAFGWQLAPECEQAITSVSAAVVNEKPVLIVQRAGQQNWWREKRSMPANLICHPELAATQLTTISPEAWDGLVLICDQQVPEGYADWQNKCVLWRPKSLVLGIGCDRNTPAHVIQQGLQTFLDEHNLAPESVAAFSSIALKADEAGIHAISYRQQTPFVTYEAPQLADVEGIENPSEFVKKITGVSSVAEAAALKKAGANRLLVPKWKYKQDGFNMTLACARIPADEAIAKKKWKNWLGENCHINAHGNEVVKGYQCKPKHVDLNRPMLYHRHHVLVCEGGRCAKEGSRNLAHHLRTYLKKLGLSEGENRIKISRTHCAGTCRNRAALVIYERLASHETPINNGLWLRNIDALTEDDWQQLFLALKTRTPLQQVLDEGFFAPIEDAQIGKIVTENII